LAQFGREFSDPVCNGLPGFYALIVTGQHERADCLGRRQHRLQRALEGVGDRAFADLKAEDGLHHFTQTLEADCLGEVKVNDQ